MQIGEYVVLCLPLVVVLMLAALPDKYEPAGELFKRQIWRTLDVSVVLAVFSAGTYVPRFLPVRDATSTAIWTGAATLRSLSVLIAIWAILRFRYRLSFGSLGFQRRGAVYQVAWSLWVGSVLAITLLSLAVVYTILVHAPSSWFALPGVPKPGSPLAEFLKRPTLHLWITVVGFLAIVTVLPFTEEVLFRAFCFTPLARKVNAIGAALSTAAMWAILHYQSVTSFSGWKVAVVFAIGIVYSHIYVRSESMIPTLTLHVLGNASSVVLLLAVQLEDAWRLIWPAFILMIAVCWSAAAACRRLRPVDQTAPRRPTLV